MPGNLHVISNPTTTFQNRSIPILEVKKLRLREGKKWLKVI